MSYLSPGLPAPVAARDGLDAPFWDGLANDKLLLQRCQSCERWQWGAEWVCHRCRSFDLTFEHLFFVRLFQCIKVNRFSRFRSVTSFAWG